MYASIGTLTAVYNVVEQSLQLNTGINWQTQVYVNSNVHMNT